MGVDMPMLARGLARILVSMSAVLACALVVSVAPASASSNLSWSGPSAVDPHAHAIGLNGVSCPSTSECVAVDGRGNAVTFNPQSPQGAATAAVSSNNLVAVNCPVETQCSAVDTSGAEVTFNPQSPSGATPVAIDSSGIPLAIVCPSALQCTAVDTAGQEVTFNPQAPGSPAPVVVDSGGLLIGVDCPTSAACYAVDTAGTAVTFNPNGGKQLAQPQSVDNSTPVALSCPGGQCVLVDTAGGAHTFSSTGEGSTTIDGNGTTATSLSSLSCVPDPSSGRIECDAVDVAGRSVSFDPTALASNPPAPVDPGQILTGVSCPTAGQCTAVDTAGQAVTYNPRSPGTPSPAVIDGQTNLSALSCPSISQCTAVDQTGGEVTFAPGSGQPSVTGNVDPAAHDVSAAACPSTGQCTAVDSHGQEVTFNPTSPGNPSPTHVDFARPLQGIACPAVTQCTAVDDGGGEVTFNPQNSGTPGRTVIDNDRGLLAIRCPSSTQCTAIDDSGDEVTFDPQRAGVPPVVAIDPTPDLDLACPNTTQCTALDSAGRQITFFPGSQSELAPESIDSTSPIQAIACRTPTGCVVVDAQGRALEGDPRGTGAWNGPKVSGASLVSLACPSATECVAVDAGGDAFTGRSGPLPPVPGGVRPPSVSGTTEQSKTLRSSTGAWSNDPTSYSYQWLRCTAAGTRCAPIKGQVGPVHTLAAADVGHRLREEVWAYNITGAGAPQESRPTATIRPYVSLALKKSSLTGISGGHPQLSLKLAVATGEQRVQTMTLSLPTSLALSRSAGRGIKVLGTRKGFKYRLRVSRHKLEVISSRATYGLHITIASSALSASRGLVGKVRAHRLKALTLRVVITEAYGGKGSFSLKASAR